MRMTPSKIARAVQAFFSNKLYILQKEARLNWSILDSLLPQQHCTICHIQQVMRMLLTPCTELTWQMLRHARTPDSCSWCTGAAARCKVSDPLPRSPPSRIYTIYGRPSPPWSAPLARNKYEYSGVAHQPCGHNRTLKMCQQRHVV